MKNIAFATCIYSDLKDGSVSRRDRYYCSLKNLLNINVPFVVYCAREEMEDISNFVGNRSNLKLIPYDLKETQYHNDWKELRTKYNHNNRCMELVHNKINWVIDAAKHTTAEKIYWIDAGLSFFSLFPHRFIRNMNHPDFQKYTDIDIFTPEWANTFFNKHLDDKIYCISISTLVCLWTHPLDYSLYGPGVENRAKFHMIGGLFGGTVQNMEWFRQEYDKKLKKVIDFYKSKNMKSDTILPVEEVVMNLIVCEYPEKFQRDVFDTWYHENHEPSFDPYKKGTPFYKLFI